MEEDEENIGNGEGGELENEVCEICGGMEEVEDYHFDKDSYHWIPDGVRDCVCVEKDGGVETDD